MDFKPNVLFALEKSVRLFKWVIYQSWLRITPIEIYSTNAKLKTTRLYSTWNEVHHGNHHWKQPESKFNANKIIVKSVSKIPQDISANIVAVSTYQEASKLMTKF
jgi:hypothetical protein